MTINLTPSEAKRIHMKAEEVLPYYREPVFWLKSKEELDAAIADWESIAAKCEAIIREAGEWEEHWERVLLFRKNR